MTILLGKQSAFGSARVLCRQKSLNTEVTETLR